MRDGLDEEGGLQQGQRGDQPHSPAGWAAFRAAVDVTDLRIDLTVGWTAPP